MTKIFIATPMYGGQCYSPYLTSMLSLFQFFIHHGIVVNLATISNESLIPRARNGLVHSFLDTDFTHLLFIDADICFNHEDIIKMIDADKDIICGIYPKKSINWDNVRNAALNKVPPDKLELFSGVPCMQNVLDGKDEESLIYDINEPQEIRFGSTGCMLIKRHVFYDLKSSVPKYRTNECAPSEYIDVFFDTSMEGEEYLSEDWHFCNLWTKQGGKIYAAPWVRLDHAGTFIYKGNFHFASAPEDK